MNSMDKNNEVKLNDDVILRLERGTGEELRLMRQTFEGKPIIQLRIWRQSREGWRPTQKGTSIRRHELVALVEAFNRLAKSSPSVPSSQLERQPERQSERIRDQWAPRRNHRTNYNDHPRHAESDRRFSDDDVSEEESWK